MSIQVYEQFEYRKPAPDETVSITPKGRKNVAINEKNEIVAFARRMLDSARLIIEEVALAFASQQSRSCRWWPAHIR
jgi:hypothetical protein